MKDKIVDLANVKTNYSFVDALRCIAMISIVMEHAMSLASSLYTPKNYTELVILSIISQFGKFGTVCFFLLAGFLIGEKFTDYTPGQYLKRRLSSTFMPWLAWSTFFLLIIIADDAVIALKFNHGHFDNNYGKTIIDHLGFVYLHSTFWFIPNFLVCITLLLIFKKWLYNYWLGFIFLLFTCAYAVNIYFEWIDPLHTTAILGFVFFLWLGAQFNRRFNAFENWIKKTPISLWLFLSAIALFLGLFEALKLREIQSVDPFNTLRFSNILYSMAIFFLLFKIRDFPFTNYIKPRQTTYGIYLTHFIISYSLLPVLFPAFKFTTNFLSFPVLLCYLVAKLAVIYGISWGLVILINKTRLKWLTGN